MPVFSIWESRFPPERVERGREVTDAIWQEMPDFSGYLRHVLIEDLDDPGDLFVVSEWESRVAADNVLGEYASSPKAAAQLAIAVPAELSVVGFDDSPAVALATPALTTVAQPHEEKGRIAAEWLIDAIERGRAFRGRRRAILPTELVVRESTAPPDTR